MRLVTFLLLAIFTKPLFAQDISLFVENFTLNDVNIVKGNGERIQLKRGNKTETFTVTLPTVIKTYKGDKFVCAWRLKEQDVNITELAFGVPTDHSCSIFTH